MEKQNKTVIVTGAEIGHTGYAIAARFAKAGYNAVAACLDKNDAEASAEAIRRDFGVDALGFGLDLRSESDAAELFAELDRLGIFAETLILNAADLALGEDPSAGTPFFSVTPEYLDHILKANVVGNFRMAKLAAERMRERQKGSIVFMSSNSAVRPNPDRVPYVTSKGAINSMARSMAVDLGKFGIRCNAIMPGTIKTARWIAMGGKQISNGSMTPIGDISDFDDIANAAYYLGSDESKNVTGTEITVDGGMSTQIYPAVLNKYRAEEITRRENDK